MKTKIIYISGNELFDMADIRSAFEEVRTALSLGPDTILFGVPVDKDDAIQTAEPEHTLQPAVEPEPIVDDIPVTPRAKRKPAKVVPISDAISPEPVEEPVTEQSEPTPQEETKETENVVPILSILGSKSPDTNDLPPQDTEQIVDQEIAEPITDNTSESDDNVDKEVLNTETVTISEIITEDVPTAEHEKTLEELLESMTPLGEDAEKSLEPFTQTDTTTDNTDNPDKSDADTDVTLEKLATEFFENQDKITTPEKTTGRGKIGKLKNILPFKKAKHDDSGLMGDLFGWAGVAANDEDFTIPGFFK